MAGCQPWLYRKMKLRFAREKYLDRLRKCVVLDDGDCPFMHEEGKTHDYLLHNCESYEPMLLL